MDTITLKREGGVFVLNLGGFVAECVSLAEAFARIGANASCGTAYCEGGDHEGCRW
jgi:hypothetical protein